MISNVTEWHCLSYADLTVKQQQQQVTPRALFQLDSRSSERNIFTDLVVARPMILFAVIKKNQNIVRVLLNF